ncbi:MAG: zinc metallopeptidase [Candidatus Poribacteria bacterium]|nr:zinc metallopeptidase [Candidatus Poribacteria bacterium]MYK17943.1 zinc metallopeptidase [Candidatus Poribacteria bacterium]
MFWGFFDPLYFVFLAPGLALSLYATFRTKRTFSKYSQVGSRSGLTGAQAAQLMLNKHGISGVRIERAQGFLSDHYDPREKTLRLSEDVYSSQSLSAIGVACHEAGHAMQDAHGYAMLSLRSALVPATNFSSTFAYIVMIAGFFLQMAGLILIGVGLFTVGVVFSLVTLPVEWDASRRARIAIDEAGMLSPEESRHASKVLNAAFLTYVAAAVTSLLTLVYYLFRLGVLGGGDE